MTSRSIRQPGWRSHLLAFIGSLVFCALALEMGLRVFYGNNPRFIYPQVAHIPTSYGYKPAPAQRDVFSTDKPVQTNAFGFRDREWQVPKPPGRTRVLVVGDSYTFGNTVNQADRYTDLLNARLQGLGDVEVINASAGGWNLDNESAFLRTEALRYEPDVLVLAFVTNDWVSPGYDREAPIQVDLSAGRRDTRPAWLQWLPYSAIFWLKSPALVAYLRDRAAAIHGGNLETALIANSVDLDRDETVAATLSELDALKIWADDHHIPMILMTIPHVSLFWVPRDSPAYLKKLAAFCDARDLAFVDASQPFWAEANPTRSLYMYPWDNHLSPEGHRLVAEQLYPAVAAAAGRIRGNGTGGGGLAGPSAP